MYGYVTGSKGMDEAREREYAATQELRDIRTFVGKAERDRFHGVGGCMKCRGRGWILTWDTLDSMSGCYAEFGPCPEKCGSGKNTDKPYLRTGGNDKYDRINYEPKHDMDEVAAEFGLADEINTAKAAVEQAGKDWKDEQEKATIQKGSMVEVYKGRKVKKGTKGRVIWVGEGQWGWRVGLIEGPDEEPKWTAATNCRIIEE